MPFNTTDIGGGQTRTRLQYEPPRRPVSAIEQIASSFRMENVLVSSAIRAAEHDPLPEDNFYPMEHLRPGEELRAEEFVDARSMEEMQIIRERIEAEERARYLREAGPLSALLTDSIAILGDPTTYLGFGTAVTAGRGVRFGTRLALGGGAGALEVGAAEAALQATQETRTRAETLGAVLLGGAFGIGLGGLGAAAAARATRAEARAVTDLTALGRVSYPEESVGAAASPRIAPEDTIVAGGPVARAVVRGLSKLKRVGMAAPSLELSVSRFATSRALVQRLVDTGIVTEGQVKGISSGASVETRIKSYNALVGQTARGLNVAFNSYRKRGGRLGRREFYENVGRAMRRGDTHEIPEIAEMAGSLRKNVFDPLKDAATAARLLPEDVEARFAASYFTRVYNREKIAAERTAFRERIVNWLRRSFKQEDLAAEAELDSIADDIIDVIMGAPTGRIPLAVKVGKRGPLKERTFNIPDEEIEDFLDSNALEVATRYVRTMAGDIEFMRMFGRLDMESEVGRLREEARRLTAEAKTPAERARIQRDLEKEAALLTKLADRIRGVDAAPFDPRMFGMVRLGRVARNLNYLRLLGSVMLSSIPDIGRVVMEEGLFRTSSVLFEGFANGFKGVRLAKDEAQAAGTALDMFLSTRVNAILDIGDRYASESRFERGMDASTRFFGIATLLDPWNTALKSMTSAVAGTRILRTTEALARGEAVSARDLRKLAQAGISEDLARRIAGQARHWERNGAVVLANAEAWTDAQAKTAFRDALLRDVDNTIITPGAGDAPLWTTREWGKTIFQFKRFGMASVQRTLVSGLQARDMAAFNGVMAMVALGALGTALRDFTSRGEIREREVRAWINEGIDRSGVLSMFYEADAVMEKFAGFSPTKSLAGEPASRFQSRSVASQVLGPSVGLLEDAGIAMRGFLKGDFTQSDLHRARRLMPAQNVAWWRFALNKAEEGIARAFGLPERQPRKRKTKVVAPTER